MFRRIQLKSFRASRITWTAATAAASIVLLSGCGDTEDPIQVDPGSESADSAEADACDLPPDLVAEMPWVRNIPC